MLYCNVYTYMDAIGLENALPVTSSIPTKVLLEILLV